MAMHDPHKEVARLARTSFDTVFPTAEKHDRTLAFCQRDILAVRLGRREFRFPPLPLTHPARTGSAAQPHRPDPAGASRAEPRGGGRGA